MIKIAILGPESTGKSTLAKELAIHFQSPWVPEFAREYMEKLSRPYTLNDVCIIALKQIDEMNFYNQPENQHTSFVFFDTDLIITKVWLDYKFKYHPDFLEVEFKKNFFDLYLLCAPDLPWESDPVREHGDDREFFFDWYKQEIEQTLKPFVIVEGFGNQRVKKAINAITNLTLN